MPTPDEIKDALIEDNRQLTDLKPRNTLPHEGAKSPDIDLDALSRHLVQTLQNDEKDKMGVNWRTKRMNDLFYYYQMKDTYMQSWPWPNASAFPVPIVAVLLDVGHTALISQSEIPKNIKVKGFGVEDRRIAPHRGKILKAQLEDQIDFELANDYNAFQVLLHGTSYIKVTRTVPVSKFGVKLTVIPIEDIYLPIDARSPAIEDTDHVTHVVNNSVQDLIIKARLRDSRGNPFFQNLDVITPGWNIGGSGGGSQELTQMRDMIYGTDLSTRASRENFYIAETHLTWWHSAGALPMELKVWWAPSTGEIFRWVLNEDGIRPFADSYIYPNHGRSFHRSLAELLKNVQDKANYSDKQATDAADIAMSPATFVDEGDGFNPGKYQRVPTGVYGIPKGSRVFFEQPNIQPIIERKQEIENLWNLAGNLSGFTEPLQGVLPSVRVTATTDVLRNRASQSRLKTVFARYNRGTRKVLKLIDFYTERYMPRKTAIKLLGVTDIQSIDELYPKPEFENGDDDRMKSGFSLDFYISSKTSDELEEERQNRILFYQNILNHQFGQEPGNAYRAFDEIAEAMGIDNFGDVIHKPENADMLSPEQMINRIMSGNLDVQPSVNINPVHYLTVIGGFQRTLSFKQAEPEKKKAFQQLLAKIELIQMISQIAINDSRLTQGQNIANQILSGQNSGQGGQGAAPAVPPNVPAAPNV